MKFNAFRLWLNLVCAGAFASVCSHAVSADTLRTPPDASAVASPSASALEMEFWKSTDRIGTVEAYRAYLAAFPKGAFASLASAALAKASSADFARTQKAPPPAIGPATSEVQGTAGLLPFSEPAQSGAVSFRMGDVFFGPGPLTVGWLGAKKQMVVPAGTWVALAAVDHNNGHSTPTQLTTVALGNFEGRALKSVLLASFNRRPGPSRTRWSDAEACEAGDPAALYQWADGPFRLRQCVLMKAEPKGDYLESRKGDVADAIRLSLQRLGAEFDGVAALRTSFFFTNNHSDYLSLVRFDMRSPARGSKTSEPGMRDERLKWAQEYRSLAASGFTRDVQAEDLAAAGISSNLPISANR